MHRFIAALFLFCIVCGAFADDSAQVRRAPARSGKFGMPHASTWRVSDGQGETPVAVARKTEEPSKAVEVQAMDISADVKTPDDILGFNLKISDESAFERTFAFSKDVKVISENVSGENLKIDARAVVVKRMGARPSVVKISILLAMESADKQETKEVSVVRYMNGNSLDIQFGIIPDSKLVGDIKAELRLR